VSASECAPSDPAAPSGGLDVTLLDVGTFAASAREIRYAIRSVCDGRAVELARDRNSICYRVPLAANAGVPGTAVVKVPRPGPQRTNDDVTFAHETAILARLPEAGIPNACTLVARARTGEGHFLLTTHVAGVHPDPASHPLDGRQLRAILDGLSGMDRQGLMHYDLNPANVLLDGDRPGFIDFEFARFELGLDAFAPATSAYCEDFNVSPNPHFPARTNVANFEFRTLCRYLAGLGKGMSASAVDDFFRDYLQEKSRCHERMADFLGGLDPMQVERMAARGGIGMTEARRRLGDGATFETTLAKLMQNASAPVAEIERALIDFRCAVFEHRLEDARGLRQGVHDRLRRGGIDTNVLPVDYLEAMTRTFDLVGRTRPLR